MITRLTSWLDGEDNMMWLPVMTCIVVLGVAVYAWGARRTARQAADYSAELEVLLINSAELEVLLINMSERLVEMETAFTTLRGESTALCSRVDRLGLRQGRLETVTGKPGFNEAIAFARHGANARELINTCGLSHGEARLVQVLYGSDSEDDYRVTPDNTSAIDAH
jgi:hypothetical protein